MNRMDDLALAQRAATGDESSLAALYDRYADLLFGFICHHLDKSRQDAEEIWQDTWLAALQSLPTYRGRSGFFTWLGGIARRKIADHCRRRGRSEVKLFSNTSVDHLTTIMDQGPLPEDILGANATRISVLEVLAVLPQEYRTALVARYSDESSVGEVARLLGKSYKATESVLSRARAAFRTALARAAEEKRDE